MTAMPVPRGTLKTATRFVPGRGLVYLGPPTMPPHGAPRRMTLPAIMGDLSRHRLRKGPVERAFYWIAAERAFEPVAKKPEGNRIAHTADFLASLGWVYVEADNEARSAIVHHED